MGGRQSVEQAKGKPIDHTNADGEEVSAKHFGFRRVEFEPLPFDHGKFREAYKGKVFVTSDFVDREGTKLQVHGPRSWRISACWARDKNQEYCFCVVKKFRRSHAQHAAEWAKDLTVQREAAKLAEKFNQTVRPPVEVQFADAFLYKVQASGSVRTSGACVKRQVYRGKCQERETVCVEPLLKGDFQKVNSNTGWVGGGRDLHHLVAQAFSHWTWAETKGEMLVCDLQGVQDSESWMFTDPAIHGPTMEPQRFGHTDLGPRGVNGFFLQHKCNEFCKKLPRPETVIDVDLPLSSHTTFSWEFPNVSFEAHSQVEFARINEHDDSGTCYAHAVATILRHAEGRIVGRQIKPHYDLVFELVEKYGTKGANSEKVLQKECLPRNLRYCAVSKQEAQACLLLGRALLMSFHLCPEQWKSLSKFFGTNPRMVLTELPPDTGSDHSGHAVVVIGFDEKNQAWKLKNSWGEEWGDGGFCRISASLPIPLRIYDVHFIEKDLRPEDWANFKKEMQNHKVHTLNR